MDSSADPSTMDLPDSTVDDDLCRKRYISSSEDDEEEGEEAKRSREEECVVHESVNSPLKTLSTPSHVEQGAAENPPISALWKLCGVAPGQLQEPPEMAAIQRPGHEVVSSILGLNRDIQPADENQKPDMYAFARTLILVLLDHNLNEILYSECSGCLEAQPAQLAHECVSWNITFFNKKLRDICDNLCFRNTLHMYILFSYSQKCLSLTNETLDYIMNLVIKVGSSESPHDFLFDELKRCNENLIRQVRHILKNRKYTDFVKSPGIIGSFKKHGI
ncbi:uncharacterized protein [Anolis sagrei]|uniref:uncharacterized protein n=1 Tax=Anolis sagrei TaxID=38937 RepID=UPI00352287E7